MSLQILLDSKGCFLRLKLSLSMSADELRLCDLGSGHGLAGRGRRRGSLPLGYIAVLYKREDHTQTAPKEDARLCCVLSRMLSGDVPK